MPVKGTSFQDIVEIKEMRQRPLMAVDKNDFFTVLPKVVDVGPLG